MTTSSSTRVNADFFESQRARPLDSNAAMFHRSSTDSAGAGPTNSL
jgi:hypothetical protein